MTVAAMRERLHEMIDEAKDGQIPIILADLEGKPVKFYDWLEDKEFVAELDERGRRYEAGIDKACTWEELEAEIGERKKNRALNG